MKVKKGECGYIAATKRKNLLVLAVYIIIAIAIFVAGYLYTGTRANIFTVVSVLMVLPGAKRIIALVVMFRRKSVTRERYDAVKEASGDAYLLADYVFTSTEKIMHLDFIIIKNGTVAGVIADSKQDVEYMKKHLKESVKKLAPEYKVKFFEDDDKFIKCIKAIPDTEVDIEEFERVRDAIYAYGV